MDRRDFTSDAEYYRAHRAAFTLAQELGVTPLEAELVIKRREQRQCRARLHSKMNAPLVPGLPELAAIRSGHEPDERPVPYWLRD